jgi:hypothetical protein
MLWIVIHAEFVWPRRRHRTCAYPALITWAERSRLRPRIGLRRDLICSNAVIRSTNRAFAAVSSSIAFACAAITTSRDAHDSHPNVGGGSVTQS